MNKNRFSTPCLGLLLSLLVMQVAATAQQELPFKGNLEGSERDVFTPPNSILVQGSGSGNATHLGLFTIEYQVLVDLATASGPACAQLTSANGDVLFLGGSGQAEEISPTLVMITESYTITGGTGRLAEASGELTVVRKVDLTTGATSGTFSGDLFLH